MKTHLFAAISSLTLLLCGCGTTTYNGWALTSAKEKLIANEGDCAYKASSTGPAWAECLVAAGQQFASAISLSRPDILDGYEVKIRRLGAEFDGGRIGFFVFRNDARVAIDGFYQDVQRAEIARQETINNEFVGAMGTVAVGVAQGYTQAQSQQRSVTPSLMVPLPQTPTQIQTPQQTPAVRSPLINDPALINCTALVAGALITTQCQAH